MESVYCALLTECGRRAHEVQVGEVVFKGGVVLRVGYVVRKPSDILPFVASDTRSAGYIPRRMPYTEDAKEWEPNE